MLTVDKMYGSANENVECKIKNSIVHGGLIEMKFDISPKSVNGINAIVVEKIWEGKNSIIDLIQSGKVNFVINTPTKGKESNRDGFKIRRNTVECKIPCFTSLDTVNALYNAIEDNVKEAELDVVNIVNI